MTTDDPTPSPTESDPTRTTASDIAIHSTKLRRSVSFRWMFAAVLAITLCAAAAHSDIIKRWPHAIGMACSISIGTLVIVLLAPRRQMRAIHADRPWLRELSDQLEAILDGDRSLTMRELVRRDDQDIERLTCLIHDLAVEASSARQRSRILHRRMHHNIRNETRRATMDLQKQALTDPLTGLGNRRALEARFEQLTGTPMLPALRFVAMAIDMDRFKEVNDALGHAVGDQCLQRLGELLRANLRRDDLAIRLGGDEFVVLVADGSVEDARATATRLASMFAQTPWPHDRTLRPTLSIGLSQASIRCAEDLSGLLQQADKALYASKEAGRNAIRVWPDQRDAA